MKGLLSALRATLSFSVITMSMLSVTLSARAHDSPEDNAIAHPVEAKRIIALGGSVTEIIYALGQHNRLVGIDQSSVYPPEVQALPSIGYYRNVPAEGVLRLKPDLVIASEQAGPSQALAQLESLGIRIERVSDQPELESLYTRVRQIANLLGVPDRGKLMRDDLELQLTTSYQLNAHRPSAMMLVMRTGKLLGAGRNTAAAKIIELSSLENALNDYTGYRPISAEIVHARMPQALIVTSHTVQSFGGMDTLLQQVVLSKTPAAMNGHIIELDDLLAQGLGPRLPLAIQKIRQGVLVQRPAL